MFANRPEDGLRGEVAGTKCVDIREEEKEEMIEFYKHLIQHSRYREMKAFVAGSKTEIPGQEIMYNYYGLCMVLLDTDYMYCASYIYVTTCKEKVPDQFNGRVVRIYSRGLHAGYLKLFDENIQTEFKRTDLVHCNVRRVFQGPADTLNIANRRKHNKELKCFISEENWMAKVTQQATTVMEDHVYAVHSQYWPFEMNEWITRERQSGFPSKSTIKQVVRYGCDLVQVSHKLSTDINEWRFSFSKAELIIIHCWTTCQRCAYRTLHVLNKMIKSCLEDSKLRTYYIKTLMLWSTEEKPAEFWSEHVLVNSVCDLLFELMHWLEQKFCPNYFIPANNMIDHLTGTELFEDIDALYQLLQNQHLIAHVLNTSRFVEDQVSNRKYYIKVPIWLYTSPLIMDQLRDSEDIFTRIFAKSSRAVTDVAISVELSDIYLGLYYYIMAGHCLIQSDNYFLMKSIEHFLCNKVSRTAPATVVVCCSRTVALFSIPSWFTKRNPDSNESDFFWAIPNAFTSADSWKVLNVDDNQTDEKFLLYSQSIDNVDRTMTTDVHFNENIYGSNKTSVTVYQTSAMDNITYAKFYKELPGISPTVNASWFINNAYRANLYYITRQDYRATEAMCDNIIHRCKQSYYNQEFAEQSLPLILSTEWTLVYDEELQAMLGLYSLCSFMFNKIDRSHAVCLGVCPILFALYLKSRCAADEMDVKRWNKCAEVTNEHFKDCSGDKRVHNGRWAVYASLKAILGKTREERLQRLQTRKMTR